MSTIRELLGSKPSSEVLQISATDTVYEAIARMSEKNVGALLVMDEDRNVLGIITERDYARKIVLQSRASNSTLVSEIMTTDVLYVTADDTAEACMALMIQKQVAHLPVLNCANGELIGLVSMGDLARAIISDHELLIDQLNGYIQGERVSVKHPERKPAETRWT